MSIKNLDSYLNPKKAAKFGDRYDARSSKFSNVAKKQVLDQYKHDSTSKKEDFVGIVLRVEKIISGQPGGSVFPYEPGSYPMKKYRGRTAKPPGLVAVKVRVPELHSMLPIPQNTGGEDCDSKLVEKSISKCWHPIIDLYPTFYAKSDGVETPKPGQIVRVRFGNLATREDPMYLGPEVGTNLRLTNGMGGISSAGGPITGEVPPGAISPSDLAAAREMGFDGKWGKIVTVPDRKVDYQLTDLDVMWAIKMVRGEGGQELLALWAMTLKFILYRFNGKSFGSSIYNALRGYSQPLSPLWHPDGPKCGPGGSLEHDQRYCNDRQKKWRRTLQSWTLTQTLQNSGRHAQLVYSWAKGQTRHPKPLCTDFASGKITRENVPVPEGTCTQGKRCLFPIVNSRPAGDPTSKRVQDGPWYVQHRQTVGWRHDYVQILPPE